MNEKIIELANSLGTLIAQSDEMKKLEEAKNAYSADAELQAKVNEYEADRLALGQEFAKNPDDVIGNWALFSALSEFARQKLTGCDSEEFVELQLENQIHRLDENGMYMDNIKHEAHQPIVYDLVPRYLFTLLLHFGYRGRHYDRIDSMLKSTALMTLKMQSIIGEIAFGGRSNQFLHTDTLLCAYCELEATRFKRKGGAV